MTRRLEHVDSTRDRIVDAALELHRLAGPANTTISAIADRAGVERQTVYRHFPDLVTLFQACTEHGMRTTGLPLPDDWALVADPLDRLRSALTAIYDYWRRNERLVGNILRDMPVSPELVTGSRAYQDHLGLIWHSVLAPWLANGPGFGRARALAATALEFGTWQALTQRYGLSAEDAVDAMVGAVETALRPRMESRPRSSEDRARPS
jgi:AcrR family transcriptional regulator